MLTRIFGKALILPLALASTLSAQQVSPVRIVPVVGVAVAPVVSLRIQAAPNTLSALPAIASLKLSPTLPSLSPTPSVGSAGAPAVPAIQAASARPLRLIIAGPPGAGKSTYGKRIAEDFGVVHISVGEILRRGAQAAPAAAAAMAKGQLVDTGLVVRLVQERLSQSDVRERGFILDGFPRRMEEAQALERWLSENDLALDAMVALDVPDSELQRRILSRGRADDSEEVFKDRMKVYHSETEPVLRHFQGKLSILSPEVSGSDASANYEKVHALLQRLYDGAPAR
jgi:adenylate kinase